MVIPGGRRSVLAAMALLAIGFGGGFLAARLSPHATALSSAEPHSGGFAWPLFSKLRAADAPRATPQKPDDFAVWTSRLALANSGPSACIRMSRPLDSRR